VKFNGYKDVSQLVNFLRSIRDPGWKKIRIWDKHPGSASLLAKADFCFKVLEIVAGFD
jgi:hypothetical protein